MSLIRLLALSYLAWAAVFVAAVVLVAHLPLRGNAVVGTSAPVATTGAVPPPAGKPDARKVARLELAPVPPFPGPPAKDEVSLPQPPAAQEPEPKTNPSRQSPPVAVAAKPAAPRPPPQPPPQPPAARPQPRAVARLDLAPAPPVPVARPHGNVSSPKPHVVKGPERKPSGKPGRVAALPKPPLPPSSARARGLTHLVSAKPAFHIPDPPPSSLANLPVNLQPAASQNRKRAAGEPAFHIPDPPPLEAGRL